MLEQSSDRMSQRTDTEGSVDTIDYEPPSGDRVLDLESVGEANQADLGGYQGRRLGFFSYLAMAWLVLLVFAAVFADLLPIPGVNENIGSIARKGPSVGHWFGGDNNGNDIFARCIHGARKSLAIGVISYLCALVIGGAIGLIAGYYRGRLESFITAMMDVLLAFPPLLLLIAVSAFLGTEMRNTIIALSILAIPNVARIIRANVLTHSQRDFVNASRTLGARNMRIMLKEILPNVSAAAGGFALVGIANLIVVEGALAFVGASDTNKVSWGQMINQGRNELAVAPHIVIFPSLMIFLTVFSMNYLGDRVRERLEVKESSI